VDVTAGKAQKRFINGNEDNLVFYYEALKREFRERSDSPGPD
jgi:hypothetical protein